MNQQFHSPVSNPSLSWNAPGQASMPPPTLAEIHPGVIEPESEPIWINLDRTIPSPPVVTFDWGKGTVCWIPREEPEKKFQRLKKKWQRETLGVSSITKVVAHPAYLRIIGIGPNAIPLILAEMMHAEGNWFTALSAITEEDPTKPEDAGDMERMTAAWLDWGRARALI
jgi:hypothetical protein